MFELRTSLIVKFGCVENDDKWIVLQIIKF